MKDTLGNPITEEEFMKDTGHGVGIQPKECTCGGGAAKSEVGGAGHPRNCPLGRFSPQLKDTGHGVVTQDWKEKIRNDYKDILSDKIIEKTIGYWESILKEQRNAVLSEVERGVEKQELKSYSSKDVEIGFNYAKEVFSTIINTLRVK